MESKLKQNRERLADDLMNHIIQANILKSHNESLLEVIKHYVESVLFSHQTTTEIECLDRFSNMINKVQHGGEVVVGEN